VQRPLPVAPAGTIHSPGGSLEPTTTIASSSTTEEFDELKFTDAGAASTHARYATVAPRSTTAAPLVIVIVSGSPGTMVAVCVAVLVAVAVGVDVAVAVGASVGEAVSVAVDVLVAVAVDVLVDVGTVVAVSVAVGSGVFVLVATGV
jgi:hypothetical protein